MTRRHFDIYLGHLIFPCVCQVELGVTDIVVISDCPVNVRITPDCRAGKYIYCSADGYPPPRFQLIDNVRGTVTHDNKVQLMEAGPFNYTCIAYVNDSCGENNPICRQNGSLAHQNNNDPNFPFSLFNTTGLGDTEYCDANKSVDGYAISELTHFTVFFQFSQYSCTTIVARQHTDARY